MNGQVATAYAAGVITGAIIVASAVAGAVYWYVREVP